MEIYKSRILNFKSESMDNQSIPIPDNKNWEYSNNQSFQIAAEQLRKTGDFTAICEKSGSLWDASRQTIALKYLGRDITITIPDITFTAGESSEIPIRERILILHYLLNARGTPQTGQSVTFKELFEGPNYFRTFTQRTIKHLIADFSERPEKLLESAISYGGKKTGYGDVSVTIPAFSRVQVTLVVWRGDDEFPADGSVLYDSSVSDYLPTEDIIVLTETIVWRLVKKPG